MKTLSLHIKGTIIEENDLEGTDFILFFGLISRRNWLFLYAEWM